MSSTERQARHRATRSVRRLFDSGYLRRVVVFAPSAASGVLSRQIVHVLSAKGAAEVGVDPRWVRTRAPKDQQVLSHDFWLVELAVLAMAGCPEPLSILTWWDDRVLAGRKRQGFLTLGNIPDGYLLIENLATGKRFPCLVELDLGSESVRATSHGRRDFTRKIEGYLPYLDGRFREEFGINAPPVVLIVADTEARLESLRETTRRLGGAGRYWFASLPHLRAIDVRKRPQDPSLRTTKAPSGRRTGGRHTRMGGGVWRRAAGSSARCAVRGSCLLEPERSGERIKF